MYNLVSARYTHLSVPWHSSVTHYNLTAHYMISKIIDYLMACLIDGLLSGRKYGEEIWARIKEDKLSFGAWWTQQDTLPL